MASTSSKTRTFGDMFSRFVNLTPENLLGYLNNLKKVATKQIYNQTILNDQVKFAEDFPKVNLDGMPLAKYPVLFDQNDTSDCVFVIGIPIRKITRQKKDAYGFQYDFQCPPILACIRKYRYVASLFTPDVDNPQVHKIVMENSTATVNMDQDDFSLPRIQLGLYYAGKDELGQNAYKLVEGPHAYVEFNYNKMEYIEGAWSQYIQREVMTCQNSHVKCEQPYHFRIIGTNADLASEDIIDFEWIYQMLSIYQNWADTPQPYVVQSFDLLNIPVQQNF